MEYIKQRNIATNSSVFRQQNKQMTIHSIICYFNLKTQEIYDEKDYCLFMTEHFKNEIFDHQFAKPNGEFLIKGKCYPSNPPQQSSFVSAQVGSISKKLYCFGRRYWKNPQQEHSKFSDPEPFDCLALSDKNAYGGPKDLHNRFGKGDQVYERKDALPEDCELPQIEYPNHLVLSPYTKGHFATFLPLAEDTLPRGEKFGKIDPKQATDLYVQYPPDFSHDFFQLAQEDQWQKGFFKGGEKFQFENLHPTEHVFCGEIPKLRARCIIRRYRDRAVIDLSMHLETIWFFPEEERGILIFKGVTPYVADLTTPLDDFAAAIENLEEEPQSVSSFFNKKYKIIPWIRENKLDAAERMLAKTFPKSAEEMKQDMMDKIQKKFQNAGRRLEKERQTIIDAINSNTDPRIPREKMIQDLPALPFTSDTKIDFDDLKKQSDQFFSQHPDITKMSKSEAKNYISNHIQSERDKMKNEAINMGSDAIKAKMKEQGMDIKAMMDKGDQFLKNIPKQKKKGVLEYLSDSIAQMKSHLTDKNVRAAAAIELQKVQDGAAEIIAKLEPLKDLMPTEPIEEEEIQLILGADRVFKNKLFEEMDLIKIDFKNSLFNNCYFDKCKIIKCSFAMSKFNSCQIKECSGESNDFQKTIFYKHLIEENVLVKSNFFQSESSFGFIDDCDFNHSNFEEFKTEFSSIEECNFQDCNFNKTYFYLTSLNENQFQNSSWEKAKTSRVIFSKNKLEFVSFKEAKILATNISDCILKKCNFKLADMTATSAFSDTVFDECSFNEAILNRFSGNGGQFQDCDFSNAYLNEAIMSNSKFIRCNFHLVEAKKSIWDYAKFTQVKITKTNLLLAKMIHAKMTGCEILKSNLFSANLYGISLNSCYFNKNLTERIFPESMASKFS